MGQIHMGEKERVTEIHQSALTDHAGSKNYTIDWENTLPVKETDWAKRGIRKTISIRKVGHINHDGGCHQLLEVFSKVLCCNT